MVKLDKINRRILFELDQNARISERKLAKIVGRSKESVRYRIQQMTHAGIIQRFTTWIDPTKLGYHSAKVYVTLANIPEKKKEFIEYVKNEKRVLWLGIAEGTWNAGMTFFVKDNEEFFTLKNEIFSRFRELILDSYTASLVKIHHYGLNYIYPGKPSHTILFSKPESNVIDELSMHILKALFQNARTPLTHLAEKNKVNVETIKQRIQSMEQSGIIVRYTIAIDATKLGYDFYKTFLYFKNITPKDLQLLIGYAELIPEIRYLIEQISPWDIELEVMCSSYAQYNETIAKLTSQFSHIIKKVETAIVSQDYVFPGQNFIFD